MRNPRNQTINRRRLYSACAPSSFNVGWNQQRRSPFSLEPRTDETRKIEKPPLCCVRLLTSTCSCEDDEQGGMGDKSLVSRTSREDKALVFFSFFSAFQLW
jgi:hypothetical protein